MKQRIKDRWARMDGQGWMGKGLRMTEKVIYNIFLNNLDSKLK